MNKERLTLLAKHLRTVTPENFDLGGWSCGTVSTGTPEEVLQAFAAALQGTTWAVHQSGDKTVTTAQPVQPPQNHVWAVSNKVAVMLFWSESAARQAGAEAARHIWG